jgi:hypothetical protein
LVLNASIGSVDVKTMTELRQMLDTCNSYVKSFTTIYEQLQSGLLPQTVSIELLADHRPPDEHRRRYNIPTSNEELAILIPGM